MKKTILTLVLAMGLLTVVSAQTKKEEQTKTDNHEHLDKATYACPMKCEGDKVYDKEGKCPKCGMDLTKHELKGKTASKKSCCMDKGNKNGHQCTMKKEDSNKQSTTYQCPMKCEGDKTYDKAGDCPKCGMHLKESKKEEK